MTNREWLNSLSDEELAEMINAECSCVCCTYYMQGGCIKCSGNEENICEKGIKEWLKKKHKEPMPTLKAGDIVQAKSYCHYVAIDPIILVRAESKERVFLCDIDISDIVMIWRSEGAEYQCIWEG